MDEQWWALIGVIVGAILGGGAQILAGILQGRRDKKVRNSELRRAAYQATLTALRRTEESANLARLRRATAAEAEGIDEDMEARITAAIQRMADDTGTLRQTIAQADLEASPAVHLAMFDAVNRCTELAWPNTREMLSLVERQERYRRGFNALVDAMRTELGREPIDRGPF